MNLEQAKQAYIGKECVLDGKKTTIVDVKSYNGSGRMKVNIGAGSLSVKKRNVWNLVVEYPDGLQQTIKNVDMPEEI